MKTEPYYCPYCKRWFPSDTHVPCPEDKGDIE